MVVNGFLELPSGGIPRAHGERHNRQQNGPMGTAHARHPNSSVIPALADVNMKDFAACALSSRLYQDEHFTVLPQFDPGSGNLPWVSYSLIGGQFKLTINFPARSREASATRAAREIRTARDM
jgi:hypothetical protein